MIKNYGFDGSKIVLEDSHYILGGLLSTLPTNIIQADGDWTPYIPTYEAQFTATYDTDGCADFGTINALKILIKKIYGRDDDYSQRFTYILANIMPPGGDPHVVAETIRKNGVIPQASLPMTDTFEHFIQPKPMTADFINQGLQWLLDKGYLHEWVWNNNPDKVTRVAKLKKALQYSPVCISVTAWMQDANGLYIDNGQPNCHWVVCIDLVEENGEFYPVIFDSYSGNNPSNPSSYIKKLHPDHHIEFSKRYAIIPKIVDTKRKSWLDIIKSVLVALGIIQEEVNTLNS